MRSSSKSLVILALVACSGSCAGELEPLDAGGDPTTPGADPAPPDAEPVPTGGSAADQCTRPAGLRCPPGSDWRAFYGLTAADYQQALATMAAQGFRLSHVNSYAVAAQPRYAAIWESCESPAWETRYGLTDTGLQAALDELGARGYRLVEISGSDLDGANAFAAIWENASMSTWETRYGLSDAEFQQALERFSAQGFRLAHVSSYALADEARHAGIWEKCSTPDWEARFGLTADEYQQALQELVGQGFRLRQMNGYVVAGQDRYSALLDKGEGPAWEARYGLTANEFQDALDLLGSQGYRLADVSGYGDRFAAIWTELEPVVAEEETEGDAGAEDEPGEGQAATGLRHPGQASGAGSR